MALHLVLASGSPRRREMLAALGLELVVRPVDLDESALPGERPEVYVRRLALAKARARCAPGEAVLAADTVVAVEGALLGKPRDADDARAMLAHLAGREHEVFTGVALVLGGEPRREASTVERTAVVFAPLAAAEIDWYVASGEPMDKAGAYAIQGLGALLVEEIRGNYSNVVGLPLPATRRLFAELGIELRELIRRT
ncbi:MAG: septum formation inhibitor Maf [Holophagales bacterium]|nr:MAG: septum formation inhibitor Maf [Holophagales bacterium]